MNDEIFKTVKFGGYDKVEVLDFIQNKFKDIDNHIETINNLKKEIEELNLKVLETEEKLATTLVENQRLVDVITHHESVLVQEYTQSQLTNAILSINKISDNMIQETKMKCEKMLNTAKSKAFQELRFKTDANDVLNTYENRFLKLVNNMSKLAEIGNTLSTSVNTINRTLNDMLESFPNDVSEK